MTFYFTIPQTTNDAASFATGRAHAASEVVQIERLANNSVMEAFTPPSDVAAQSCRLLSPPRVEKWTSKEERRFDQLAEAHALGNATKDEIHELQSFINARNVLLAPIPSAEILRVIRSRKLTSELMDVLNRYVEFHHPKADSCK